jgi:hypothetical protein
MATSYEPTERDRYWLAHESALAASGKTAKAYAADHELSLHAFYQARKRLRALGLLPAGRSCRGSKKAPHQPVSFSRVELASGSEIATFVSSYAPRGGSCAVGVLAAVSCLIITLSIELARLHQTYDHRRFTLLKTAVRSLDIKSTC